MSLKARHINEFSYARLKGQGVPRAQSFSKSGIHKRLKAERGYSFDHFAREVLLHEKQSRQLVIYGSHSIVHVKGWLVDHKGNSVASKVFLRVDDVLFPVEYGSFRSDVANKLKNKDLAPCGFQVNIPGAIFVEAMGVSLIFKGADGQWQESQSLTVDLRPLDSKTIKEEEDAIGLCRELDFARKSRDLQALNMYGSLSWKITKPFRWTLDAMQLVAALFNRKKLKAATNEIKEKGIVGGVTAVLQNRKNFNHLNQDYKLYLRNHHLGPKELADLKEKSKQFKLQPKISILTPVHNVDRRWLNACVNSVLNQVYSNWELCLYDDSSSNAETLESLKSWESSDPRIKVRYGKENLHISGASNMCLEMATGEYVGLLDNDDELTQDALYEVVKAINANREVDFFFSDEDKLEMNGERTQPYFKPGFNEELFLSNNYLCHFSVIRKKLLDEVSGFRMGYEGSQDYDLFLRVYEKTDKIQHIPKVLYHWRKIPGSTAAVYDDKSYANTASIKALTDHLQRNGEAGEVANGLWPGSFRIKRELKNPKVSIIIPFKDHVQLLEQCLDSIWGKSTYDNYEIILINNNSEEKATERYLKEISDRCKVHDFPGEFNFSEINNFGVSKATGEYLILLNNDTEVIQRDWIEAMLEQAVRQEVGAVGAKLLYPDGKVQHAGVIFGLKGLANHAFLGKSDNDNLYYGNANVIRNYSAVSAACLMVSKKDFLEVGGMEKNLAVAYNDLDFCLKLKALGRRNVYTPFAKLVHKESKSRGYENSPEKRARLAKEEKWMLDKWGREILKDEYFNQNLDNSHMDFRPITHA